MPILKLVLNDGINMIHIEQMGRMRLMDHVPGGRLYSSAVQS